MTELIAICLTCKYHCITYLLDGKMRCKKFPDGVPEDILIRENCDYWDDLFEDDEEEED